MQTFAASKLQHVNIWCFYGVIKLNFAPFLFYRYAINNQKNKLRFVSRKLCIHHLQTKMMS